MCWITKGVTVSLLFSVLWLVYSIWSERHGYIDTLTECRGDEGQTCIKIAISKTLGRPPLWIYARDKATHHQWLLRTTYSLRQRSFLTASWLAFVGSFVANVVPWWGNSQGQHAHAHKKMMLAVEGTHNGIITNNEVLVHTLSTCPLITFFSFPASGTEYRFSTAGTNSSSGLN